MRNFVQDYNELCDRLRADEFNLNTLSEAELDALMRQEFVLKWLAAKQTAEQIVIDTQKQKEAHELRKSILTEEMVKAGYSGDNKGTLEDWIKFLSTYKDDNRFYGLKSKNDKLMKSESFKKKFIEDRAANILAAPEQNLVQYLYDAKIIKLEDNPRFQELPSKDDAQK